MSVKALIQEIKKGLKESSYLLYAGEEFFLKEALSMLRCFVPEEKREFLYTTYDANSPEFKIEALMESLHSAPFFVGSSQRQVIVLENSQELSDKEAKQIERYLKDPSPDTIFVLLYLTQKGRIAPLHKEKLSSAVAIPVGARQSEIVPWIKEKTSALEIELTPEAIEYLLEEMGADFGSISSEIDKLSRLGKKTIDRADLRELIKGSRQYEVFDLTRAIIDRDTERAFKIYSALKDEVPAESLLGAINWQYQSRPSKDMAKIFEILNDADIRLKSTASLCLMEEVLFKLLRS